MNGLSSVKNWILWKAFIFKYLFLTRFASRPMTVFSGILQARTVIDGLEGLSISLGKI